MIKMLIIDEETVNVLSYASIKPLWFTDYQIPLTFEQRIKRVQIVPNIRKNDFRKQITCH